MSLVHLDEPRVPVNARTGVPARVVERIVEPHRDDIAAGFQGLGQIHAPRRITVRPAAEQVSVEPDRGVGHGAVKVEENGLGPIYVRGRGIVRSSVPAHAITRQTTHAAADPGRVEGTDNGPVMGKVDALPAGVVEGRLDVLDIRARSSARGRWVLVA